MDGGCPDRDWAGRNEGEPWRVRHIRPLSTAFLHGEVYMFALLMLPLSCSALLIYVSITSDVEIK